MDDQLEHPIQQAVAALSDGRLKGRLTASPTPGLPTVSPMTPSSGRSTICRRWSAISAHAGEPLAEATAVLVVELRHHSFNRLVQAENGIAPAWCEATGLRQLTPDSIADAWFADRLTHDPFQWEHPIQQAVAALSDGRLKGGGGGYLQRLPRDRAVSILSTTKPPIFPCIPAATRWRSR
jgi:hypothetical protein